MCDCIGNVFAQMKQFNHFDIRPWPARYCRRLRTSVGSSMGNHCSETLKAATIHDDPHAGLNRNQRFSFNPAGETGIVQTIPGPAAWYAMNRSKLRNTFTSRWLLSGREEKRVTPA